jgi:hypothetical protein
MGARGNALDERGKRAESAAANPEAGESLGTDAGRKRVPKPKSDKSSGVSLTCFL